MRIDAALLVALAALVWLGWATPHAPDAWAPTPRPTDTLRVVTWNVGRADGDAGGALTGALESSVLATLRALDADLVALQELRDAEQARSIARGLGDDVAVQVETRGARTRAVLVRRGSLTRSRARGLPERRPLLVRFTPRGGDAIAVAVLHGSPWSAAARNREIGAAVDWLADAGAPMRLLLGDLNLEVELEGRQDLYTDDAHLDLETYGYATERLVDVGRTAGATARPDRRIDYVLVDPAFDVRSAGVWRGRRAGEMDHEPLVCDLRRTSNR